MSSRLHEAAKLRQSQLLMKLLAKSEIVAQINCYDQTHRTTPLMLAVEADNWENVQLLLHSGADPNLSSISLQDTNAIGCVNESPTDNSRISSSSEDEYSRAVRFCGVSESIFHSAVKRGNADIVALLIQKGADVHQKSSDGSTPLHTAVSSLSCGFDVVELLIEAGANIYAEDNFQQTPIQLALLSRLGHEEGEILVKLMFKAANLCQVETV